MSAIRAKVEKLVLKGIKEQNYEYIREAMSLCSDESGVFMCEADDYVMIDDDIFRFNGAF